MKLNSNKKVKRVGFQQPAATRYTAVAITLHWVIAVTIFAMLASGLIMNDVPLEPAQKFMLYQWHKSLGVLVLLAVCARILWRFVAKPPALPAGFKPLDVKAAKLGHLALYAAMIVMPLTGWLMVSASVYGLPTVVFDMFTWPHIPGLEGNQAVEGAAHELHEIFATGLMILIALHIAALVKHAVMDKVNLMPRMWFGKTPLKGKKV